MRDPLSVDSVSILMGGGKSETLLPEIMDAMIEDRAAQASPLRDRFLAAGMTVLGRDGYPGFKQAAVCRQTGLTTGAFYHSFRNWKEFEAALIEHWRAGLPTASSRGSTSRSRPTSGSMR